MDKIKIALEKARQEREAGQSTDTASRNRAEQDLTSIKYTQTRSIDVADNVLREHRLINALEQSEYTDSIKRLRTQVLQRMEDNGWNVLAVTSASRGEGKTQTALNLGISIAMEVEYTVLVVDANLRHPSVHEYFGMESSTGLSDYLKTDIALSEILVNPKNIEHFVIIPGGKPMHNSAEMLSSPRMGSMVEELKKRYPKRIVIFDLPPLLGAADALAFAPYIDAALLVVEDGVVSETDLRAAVDMLSVTNVIGTVLNKSTR
ncbi:MAG: CpsD/CapB family tyrosine-protein kinase [Gammaproteobacteria bacterium]|nr:CpsD/CapB family tyrosine-protein kinase [Gammaproteobacteria bacterium]